MNKAKIVFDNVVPADFFDPLHAKIAQVLNFKIKEGKLVSVGEIINDFGNEEEKIRVVELFSHKFPNEMNDNVLYSSLETVKKANINRRIQELINQMNVFYETGEKENANKIYNKIVELQKINK